MNIILILFILSEISIKLIFISVYININKMQFLGHTVSTITYILLSDIDVQS